MSEMIKCEYCGKEFDSEAKVKLHQLKSGECLRIQEQLENKESIDYNKNKDTIPSDKDESKKTSKEDEQKKLDAELSKEMEEHAANIKRTPKVGEKSYSEDVLKYNKSPFIKKNINKVELKDKSYIAYWSRKDKIDEHVEKQNAMYVRYKECENLSAPSIVDGDLKVDENSIVTKMGDILLKIPKDVSEMRKKEKRKENPTAIELEQQMKTRFGLEGSISGNM